MKFNSYTLIARVFPAVLSSFPFFVVHYFYLRPALGQFWNELLGVQAVSDVTISLVFLFLLIQLSRHISKGLFEKCMFNDGLSLPTTDYLLHGSSYYSPEYRQQIHSKIRSDFGIEIPASDQEMREEEHSRRIAAEAVSRIRARVGAGVLVGQHNAEYGFIRNLMGGSVLALGMCVIDLGISIFTHELVAGWISFVLAIAYAALLLFSKKLIRAFGNNYARVLIQEYMSG